MTNAFTREDRYIVFKVSDVERYLTDADRAHLAMMKHEIDAGRDCSNEPPFKGLIVEADWPEYESTWRAIEERVTGAQPAPHIPDGWLERGLAELENIRNRFDDSTLMNDKTLIERLFIAMTTTPEAKE